MVPVAAELAPGSLVGGDFRVVGPLSAGGMGAVYVAEQQSTGKRRALKVMHPSLVSDPALRERFAQEARVGSMIQSDHVVQVVGAGVDAQTGAPWLAMELLEGENLAQYMARHTALTRDETLEVLRPICHALGAAHAAGVVHRDVKPENVFLARSHSTTAPVSVKVLDFGIAKLVAQAHATSTAMMGTPLWMAPEQSEPHARISPATDVWALGLMAFWMLTGRSYWRSVSAGTVSVHQLLREILFEPVVPASLRAAELGVAPRIPAGFDAWLARCLEREPARRFADARAAYAGLAQLLGGEPTLAYAQASPAAITLPQAALPTPAYASAESGASFTPALAPSARRPSGGGFLALVAVGAVALGLALVIAAVLWWVDAQDSPIPLSALSAGASASVVPSARAPAPRPSAR